MSRRGSQASVSLAPHSVSVVPPEDYAKLLPQDAVQEDYPLSPEFSSPALKRKVDPLLGSSPPTDDIAAPPAGPVEAVYGPPAGGDDSRSSSAMSGDHLTSRFNSERLPLTSSLHQRSSLAAARSLGAASPPGEDTLYQSVSPPPTTTAAVATIRPLGGIGATHKLEGVMENLRAVKEKRQALSRQSRQMARTQAQMTQVLEAYTQQGVAIEQKCSARRSDTRDELRWAAVVQDELMHRVSDAQTQRAAAPMRSYTWAAHIDSRSGKVYYYNRRTGVTTWSEPQEQVDVTNLYKQL